MFYTRHHNFSSRLTNTVLDHSDMVFFVSFPLPIFPIYIRVSLFLEQDTLRYHSNPVFGFPVLPEVVILIGIPLPIPSDSSHTYEVCSRPLSTIVAATAISLQLEMAQQNHLDSLQIKGQYLQEPDDVSLLLHAS